MRILFGLLFAFVLVTGRSQAAQFGEWETGVADDGEYYFAITANDSGSIFGQFCYKDEGSCLWLVSFATECKKDSEYPALASGASGASSVTIHCFGTTPGMKGHYRYIFTDFDTIDKMVRGGTQIGVVVPLASEQFKVFRFNLNGAVASINSMRRSAQSGRQGGSTRPTRDKVL